MATYKEIKGVTVQTKDEDPVQNVGSWSSGGSINEARYSMGGAGLTPSAAIIFGGSPAPGSPTLSSKTESYNGSTWAEVNDMPANRAFNAGAGTSSAAVSFGGTAPGAQDSVYEWDGTNWSTNPNAYPASYYSMAAAGTATAAIISGGNPAQTVVNTFDGTSFTSSTAMNTGRRGHGSVGTTTANLVSCGETPRTANTELWNGSSWTEVNDYPTATQDLSMWGTSTSALGALGYDTANTANSASWDGTSWTETADLANARNGAQTGGIGSDNTEGLVAGGDNSGRKDFTEEWGFPPPTAAILNEGDLFLSGGTTLKGFGRAGGIPSATWASAASLNTARSELTGSQNGTQDAMLAFGTPPNVVESYNGTSWSEVNETSSSKSQAGGLGTQTAALLCFGNPPAGGGATPTEEWNGSSWTEKNDGNTGRYVIGACGTTTAGLAAGGLTFPPAVQKANTETWDGTSWTEVNDMNTASRTYQLAGVQTSSISAGRGEPNISNVETWNGTSWSEVAEINTPRREGSMSGFDDGNALLITGDSGPPLRTNTEFWNGSSWTELNDVSTARRASTGGASAAKSIIFGGNTGSATAATEEWTADNTLSTVTVS